MQKSQALLPLSSGVIHLWLAFPDEIKDQKILSAYEDLLSADETIQWQRFHFARRRHQYLVTRALIRTVLSKYIDIAPRCWRFSKNSYGKPEILNAIGDVAIRFNISHTDGLIICGIVLNDDIGVDVEDCQRKNSAIDLADRYFSKQEADDLHALPASEQCDRFFTYWTLKESYIKARGMGLSLPLDQFTFHIAPGRPVRISFDPRLKDNSKQWRFWRLKPSPKHKVAIALKSRQVAAYRLMVNKSVPLVGRQPFACEIVTS
ncbi:MAG: 4'-phosphopantetheinyl transferase superfamily protein [Desulfobacteraceae bacterium]|nr:4'-phosphopantetheinyl transferase superfamily protein [Desulfobacteraceae bacterium]